MSSNQSLGEKNYQTFAQRYAEVVETKPHNAYLERPASLSLLPPLMGKRALDAGCGPGICTEWMLNHGAAVVAFDVTPAFVDITRQRVGERATVIQADVGAPLTFAEAESFDVILCSLVMDYIENWRPVFDEFYRVLRPGGVLVFSFGHPFADWVRDWTRKSQNNYYAVEQFTMFWTGFGEPKPQITAYRRPLQDAVNPLIEAGFRLDRVLEPQPLPEFEPLNPEDYAQFMREPSFMCLRAVK